MKKKTTLLVAALSTVAVVGSAVAFTTIQPVRTINAAEGDPLVLTVVDGETRNIANGIVKTALGNDINVSAMIGERDGAPTFSAMKSFANLDSIGSITGFEIVGDNQAVNNFSLSYGYEKDGEGNPIYVKQNLETSETGWNAATFTLKYEFAKHSSGAVLPNFIRLTNEGWKAIQSFKVFYGSELGNGSAACAPSATPSWFKTPAKLDYVDPSMEDIVMDYQFVSPTWQGNLARYETTLTNPKAGTKFSVLAANGKPIALPKANTNDWKGMDKYFTRDEKAKTLELKADLNGTMKVISILSDMWQRERYYFEIIDNAVEVDYRLFGIHFTDLGGNWWKPDTGPASAVGEKVGDIVTFKNIKMQGGKRGNDGTATEFVVAENLKDAPNKIFKLDTNQDPTIATQAGNHVLIMPVDPAIYNIKVNLTAKTVLVTLA